MSELHTLIESLAGDPGNLPEIRAKVADLGLPELERVLRTNGLDIVGKVRNAQIASDLIISVLAPNVRAKRRREPKTIEGLVSGHVFEDDPNDVIHRFATKRDAQIKVWMITESDRGRLRLVEDFALLESEVPDASTLIPTDDDDLDCEEPLEDC